MLLKSVGRNYKEKTYKLSPSPIITEDQRALREVKKNPRFDGRKSQGTPCLRRVAKTIRGRAALISMIPRIWRNGWDQVKIQGNS
jgi:hypothetical protein